MEHKHEEMPAWQFPEQQEASHVSEADSLAIHVDATNYGLAWHFPTQLFSPILNLGSHVEVSAFHFLWVPNSWELCCLREQVVVWVRHCSGRSSRQRPRANTKGTCRPEYYSKLIQEGTGPTLLRSPDHTVRRNLGTDSTQDVPGSGAISPQANNNEAVLTRGHPSTPPCPSKVATFPDERPGGVVTNPGLNVVQLPSLKGVSVGLLTVGIKQWQTQHRSNVLSLGLSSVPHPSRQGLWAFKD